MEIQQGEQTYWALDHACANPGALTHSEPSVCQPVCSHPELASNRYW